MNILKSKMTTLVAVATMFIFSNFSLAEINHDADLIVTSGYPYVDLVKRYETVKIHYTQSASTKEIECRVELSLNGSIATTRAILTRQQDFEAAPLKSCLARDDAKQALATTFN